MFAAQRIVVLLFGAVVVGFRLPGVINPLRFKAWLSRTVFGESVWVRVFGVLFLACAVVLMVHLWDASTVTGVLTIVFACALLAASGLAFAMEPIRASL